jgi:hypothetical protein
LPRKTKDGKREYSRRSKKEKELTFLSPVNITDLSAFIRKFWTFQEISIPEAKLWCLGALDTTAEIA